MKNKRILIFAIILVVIFIGAFIYKQVKKIEQDTLIKQEQQAILEQQKLEEEKRQAEEKRKQEELEEKENQYKNNSKYQAFKDETFKIRFYYDNESLKYGSAIAQGGKLALQERNGSNMFLYSTNEMTIDYDKNQFVENYIKGQVSDGFTITENKDITISKIKPVEARYVECQRANVLLKNYIIYNDKGMCRFTIGSNIGVESSAINEILDTIICE